MHQFDAWLYAVQVAPLRCALPTAPPSQSPLQLHPSPAPMTAAAMAPATPQMANVLALAGGQGLRVMWSLRLDGKAAEGSLLQACSVSQPSVCHKPSVLLPAS
jgi:hypothetical protein